MSYSLEFSAISAKNAARVRAAYRYCTYRVSDYSFGMKRMWKSYFHTEVAFFADCMIVKECFGGAVRFDYPVPETEQANIEQALTAIEQYCMEHYIPLIYYAVPEDCLPTLCTRYRQIRTESSPLADEYIYQSDTMATFVGKHYAGQRNHINKFNQLYPRAVFRELTPEDKPALERFFARFSYAAEQKEADAEQELAHAAELMKKDLSWSCAGCMTEDGEILSVSVGEICGDTMILHIEKALYTYEGIYPATVAAFAKRFCGGVRYINREEDCGDPGLRRSKMQYRPCAMQRKYDVYVQTELARWDAVPTLQTERLLLRSVTREDQTAYNALCLNDEHNRYWGYDYRTDCEHPDEAYFVSVCRADFKTRTAANFAVCLPDGTFIGECILFDFDYHGTAWVGVRISKRFCGHGYGKEAVREVIHAGLYSLGLCAVRAKCYKENQQSFRMLSAVLERDGEDDTYYYFIEKI